VRLEAHRLRRDLEHYYLTAGAADAIRIDVPKGGYAPVFTAAADRVRAPSADTAPAAPAISPRWRRGRLVAASALLLLATAGLATLWLHPGFRGRPTIGEVAQERGPSLVVHPFRGLDGGEAAALLATGLTNQLVADLMRVESLRVYAGGGAPSSGVGVGSAAPPPVAFRVEGTVQRDAATIRVTARLVDAASDEVLWSEALDRPASMASVLAVQEELARSIAERLALPNGAIAVAAERPAGSRPAATMFAFDCVQRAWLYRRRSDGADRAAVLACLDDTVALEPG
jgi:TolB-like protein